MFLSFILGLLKMKFYQLKIKKGKNNGKAVSSSNSASPGFSALSLEDTGLEICRSKRGFPGNQEITEKKDTRELENITENKGTLSMLPGHEEITSHVLLRQRKNKDFFPHRDAFGLRELAPAGILEESKEYLSQGFFLQVTAGK